MFVWGCVRLTVRGDSQSQERPSTCTCNWWGESRDGKSAPGGMLISDLVSRPSERLTLVDEVLSYFESVFLPGAEEIT